MALQGGGVMSLREDWNYLMRLYEARWQGPGRLPLMRHSFKLRFRNGRYVVGSDLNLDLDNDIVYSWSCFDGVMVIVDKLDKLNVAAGLGRCEVDLVVVYMDRKNGSYFDWVVG